MISKSTFTTYKRARNFASNYKIFGVLHKTFLSSKTAITVKIRQEEKQVQVSTVSSFQSSPKQFKFKL